MNTAFKEESFVLVIHGHAPELWRGMAYRKADGFSIGRCKIIKCPYCGRNLISIGITTKVSLYRYPSKAEVQCHEYKTCSVCHHQVGIQFT